MNHITLSITHLDLINCDLFDKLHSGIKRLSKLTEKLRQIC